MGLISMISLKAYYRSNIIELLSNDLYKNDVTHCIQTGSLSFEDLLNISNNTFISKKLSANTRGIYFSNQYSYNLPVIEGRFFTGSDFNKDNNYVVVGKNLEQLLYEKDNKTYYRYSGVDYEVIGILGFDIDTKLNDIIFFNLANIYDIAPKNTELVIGEDYQTIINKAEILKIQDSIYVAEIPNKGVSRIWSAPNIYITVTFTTYICCLLSVLFLIYLKSYYYDNYIKTFQILGFNKIYTYRTILFTELKIYILALCFGVFIAFPLFIETLYINSEFKSLTFAFLIINCIMISSFDFTIFRKNINKNSKGGNRYDVL